MADETPGRKGLVLRFLDAVERIGNRLPDPITLFALLALTVIAISAFAALAGVRATHPGTGAEITAVNLLAGEQVRRMMTGAVGNFAAFPPLGLVIVVIIGIGVTEHSGLIAVALKRLVSAVPESLLTATLVFAGIMSSMAVDAGYVVLTPLGAMLFAAIGRHPLAGLAAAFAGVSAGFSANLLITSLDPLLSGLSTEAAQLVDPTYEVQPTANYYFMVASVFLLTALGTWVTHRFVEPRLGTWDAAFATDVPDTDLGEISPSERRGLAAAGISVLVFAILVAMLVVPENGVLRNPEAVAAGEPYYVQIAPFLNSIVTILMLMFMLAGIVYGVVAGTIRSDKDVARMSSDGVAVLGSYIVLAFFAAQFVAYFNWSNLGLILAIKGADGLRGIGFTGLPLLLSFVVVSAFINLFIGSASAKWAVMAPVFVPMLMLVGYSPEVVQAAYRVGDSTTNIITPLMQYFPVIIAFAQRYDRRSGIGTLISAMLPYSIVFMIGWLALFAVWAAVGLPMGPGAPMHYAPPQ
jgi:aminobenzoyl-glutamate transport protein